MPPICPKPRPLISSCQGPVHWTGRLALALPRSREEPPHDLPYGTLCSTARRLLFDHALVVECGGATTSCHRPSCTAHQDTSFQAPILSPGLFDLQSEWRRRVM